MHQNIKNTLIISQASEFGSTCAERIKTKVSCTQPKEAVYAQAAQS
jgi:hypothetical protein